MTRIKMIMQTKMKQAANTVEQDPKYGTKETFKSFTKGGNLFIVRFIILSPSTREAEGISVAL